MSSLSQMFVKDIAKKVILNNEEELAIFKKISKKQISLKKEKDIEKINEIKKKINEYKKKIVESYFRLILNIAKKYKSNSISVSDLISEGAIAIMEAIHYFDYSKKVRFISYVYPLIKKKMITMVLKYNYPINMPKRNTQILNYFNEIQSKNLMLTGKKLPFQTVTKQMGIDSHKVNEIIKRNYDYISIESNFQKNDGVNIEKFLAYDKKFEKEELEKVKIIKKYIKEIKLLLKDKEYFVLSHYFGLEGSPPQKFNQLAKELNMSAEGVRRIYLKTINKIKQSELYYQLEKKLN